MLCAGPAAALASLGLRVEVDPVTGAQLGQLQLAKQEAVASEDYDEAKRLKTSIDRCGFGCCNRLLHSGPDSVQICA